MLVRGINAPDNKDVFNNVSFIVFNYDRCLEFFLVNTLQLFFGISDNAASAIVTNVDITHPYGMIAPLPFVGPRDTQSIPFGGQRGFDYNPVPLADNIKTYTEQTKDAAVLERIQVQMREAECIVFLGFAFHRQNMDLLRITNKEPKFIYATAHGMADPRVDYTRTFLYHLEPTHRHTCRK